MTADPYHVDIIREKLTRTLPAVLPEVVDELGLAVQEYIGARDDGGTYPHIEYERMSNTTSNVEWTAVKVMPVMQHIVSRASNRAFVGLPLCALILAVLSFEAMLSAFAGRNEGFLELAVMFTRAVVKDRNVMALVPRPLKP